MMVQPLGCWVGWTRSSAGLDGHDGRAHSSRLTDGSYTTSRKTGKLEVGRGAGGLALGEPGGGGGDHGRRGARAGAGGALLLRPRRLGFVRLAWRVPVLLAVGGCPHAAAEEGYIAEYHEYPQRATHYREGFAGIVCVAN